MKAPETRYVLGTAEDEIGRLGLQHQIWQPQICALWARAGFGPGQSLLDAGCGPGFSSIDLALLTGAGGRVLGVDLSAGFIAEARARARALGLERLEFRTDDLATVELEPASLDGIFLRWVISFVPHPREVIARLAAALKPGGAMVVVDYFHYRGVRMVPGGELFDRLFEYYDKANRMSGGDYERGAQVPGWALEAGLTVERLEPLTQIARPGDRYWHWFVMFCRVFAPKLPQMGLVDEDFVTQLFAALDAHERDPAAFFLTPPIVGVIARR